MRLLRSDADFIQSQLEHISQQLTEIRKCYSTHKDLLERDCNILIQSANELKEDLNGNLPNIQKASEFFSIFNLNLKLLRTKITTFRDKQGTPAGTVTWINRFYMPHITNAQSAIDSIQERVQRAQTAAQAIAEQQEKAKKASDKPQTPGFFDRLFKKEQPTPTFPRSEETRLLGV